MNINDLPKGFKISPNNDKAEINNAINQKLFESAIMNYLIEYNKYPNRIVIAECRRDEVTEILKAEYRMGTADMMEELKFSVTYLPESIIGQNWVLVKDE